MDEEKPTIEIRVHHLHGLMHHIEDGRSLKAIRFNLEIARYGDGVTKKELDKFAQTVYDFFEKILEGKHEIELVDETDGLCNSDCPSRRTEGCDLKRVTDYDQEEAKLENWNVEIGKTYTLDEILYKIQEYQELRPEEL